MSTTIAFGAASAICAEVLKQLARQGGGRFLLAGRSNDKLMKLKEQLSELGAVQVEVFACDLSDVSTQERVLQLIDSGFADFDTAIVAWGVLPDQKACETESKALAECIQTNFTAQATLLNAVALRLEKRGGGRIVAFGSVAGDRGRQSNYAYGSCKAALEAFCSGLRNRLSGKKISVLLVKPGFVDTPMTAGIKKNALFAKPDAVAVKVVAAMGRGAGVVYVPWFWSCIMLAIRAIPETVFKRMRL